MENENRNLWAELQASESIQRRRRIEQVASIVYAILILSGAFVSIVLYTRPDNLLLKVWGVIAALCLGTVSIVWAQGMKHAAEGHQRNLARIFWGLDMLILLLNIGSEFAFQLIPDQAPSMFYGFLYYWYYVGSSVTVVLSLVGLALLNNFSPDQIMHDKAMQGMKRAADAFSHALDHPTKQAQEDFNQEIEGAAHAVAQHSGAVIRAYASQITGGNSKRDVVQNGNHQHEPMLPPKA